MRQTRSGSHHHTQKGFGRPRLLGFQSAGSRRRPIIPSSHGRRTLPERFHEWRHPQEASADAAFALLWSGSEKSRLQGEPDLPPLSRAWIDCQASANPALASNPLRTAHHGNRTLSSRTRLCQSLCENRSMISMIFLCKIQRSHG